MNSIHNNGENDKSLNDDLDKLGRTYARLEQDEPPDLLDQAILNSAHRALEKKPHWMKFGWVHGLTTAAIFVLALTLIINQRESSPVIPDGIDRENLSVPHLEVRSKKQSREVKSDDFRQLSKEKSVGRSDVLTNAPSAAADSAAAGTAPAESSGMMQESTYADQVLQAEPAIGDEADRDTQQKTEEVLMQETEPLAEPEKAVKVNGLRQANVVAAPPATETSASSKADEDIRQQLLAIIKLRQSGNELWRVELKAFIEHHPDYPLPHELSN